MGDDAGSMSLEQKREVAAEVILDHSRGADRLDIAEALGDRLDGLSYADRENLIGQVQDLVSTATITVSWPDADPGTR